jgi:tryptophanyl-tRNA synthetase
LSDPETVVRDKVSGMITDPARKRRTDPGNPDICPVFALHKLCSPVATIDMVNVECRRAGIGCVEDKKLMADNLVKMLAPIQQRRRVYEEDPQQVRETMDTVRTSMNLKRPSPVVAK